MADYSPVWPRHRYNQQQDGNGPFEISGTDLFGVFNIGQFFANGLIRSPVVSQYSEIEQDEIFYFVAYKTSGGNEARLYAVKANGEKSGGGFTSNSILWTFSNTEGDNHYFDNYCLSISSDGETIYFSPSYDSYYDAFLTTKAILFAINASDGTEKWKYSIGPNEDYRYAFATPVIEDASGFPHVIRWQMGFANIYWYGQRSYVDLIKLNRSNGTIEDTKRLNENTSSQYQPIPFLATNPSKTFIYTGYYGSRKLSAFVTELMCAVVKVKYDYSEDVSRILINDNTLQDVTLKGIAYGGTDNLVYSLDNTFGLVKSNFTTGEKEWNFTGTDPTAISSAVGPAINDNGEINYRQDNILYTIQSNGTERPSSQITILPTNDSRMSPILTPDGNIIIASSNADIGNNIHVINNDGVDITPLYSFRSISSTKYIIYNVSLGDSFGSTNNILYQPVHDPNLGTGFVYLVKSSVAPTTTTTTTLPVESSSSESESSQSESESESETSEPTTTTTTTLAPLDTVKTTFIDENPTGIFNTVQETNASDSDETKNTVFSESMTFGTIAPGESSKIIIAQLNIPYVKAFTNIKLGLIDSGGITLQDGIFGITSSNQLISNNNPTSYFQGVNSNSDPSSPYNVSILNSNNNSSQYIYLQVNLPRNSPTGPSVVRYRWFFDYAE